jgi:hypothetical protein
VKDIPYLNNRTVEKVKVIYSIEHFKRLLVESLNLFSVAVPIISKIRYFAHTRLFFVGCDKWKKFDTLFSKVRTKKCFAPP